MIDAEIVERLQEQQRSLRRQRWINSALIAGLAGIILLAASRPQSSVDESIRTRGIVIVDETGEDALRISDGVITDASGSTVATFGPDGIRARRLTTLAANGSVAVEIGSSPVGGYLSLSGPEAPGVFKLVASKAGASGQIDGIGAGIFGSFVPIGGIIPFWGGPEELGLLENFELCDGSEITRADSPIKGRQKPDLRNKFLAGADRDSLDLWSSPVFGGTDTTPAVALGRTEGHALTIAEMPRHSHNATASTVTGASLANGGRLVTAYVRDSGRGTPDGVDGNPGGNPEFDIRWRRAVNPADHTHSVTVSNSGGGRPHSHRLPAVPSHDNRPSFAAVHFIIRVK